MKGPLISQRWFFAASVAVMAASHAFDLFGTYLYQPNFEHEVNPFYRFLDSRGFDVGWREAILGKTLFTLVTGLMLWDFVKRRKKYFPPPGSDFVAFNMMFMFGRTFRGLEYIYALPKRLGGSWLYLCGTLPFLSIYTFALGYDNIAAKYGWPEVPSVRLGYDWLDLTLVLFAVAVFCVPAWQLWAEYRLETPSTDRPEATSTDTVTPSIS